MAEQEAGIQALRSQNAELVAAAMDAAGARDRLQQRHACLTEQLRSAQALGASVATVADGLRQAALAAHSGRAGVEQQLQGCMAAAEEQAQRMQSELAAVVEGRREAQEGAAARAAALQAEGQALREELALLQSSLGADRAAVQAEGRAWQERLDAATADLDSVQAALQSSQVQHQALQYAPPSSFLAVLLPSMGVSAFRLFGSACNCWALCAKCTSRFNLDADARACRQRPQSSEMGWQQSREGCRRP